MFITSLINRPARFFHTPEIDRITLPNNLISYWSFNSGSALDSVSNTIRNATSSAGSYTVASCFSGDGTTRVIAIPKSSSLDIMYGGATDDTISVVGWIYPKASNTNGCILNVGASEANNTGQGGYGIALLLSNLKLRFNVRWGSPYSTVGNFTALSTGSLTLNTWNHIAATYHYSTSGVIVIKFYINGILDSTVTSSTPIQKADFGTSLDVRTTIGALWRLDSVYANYLNANIDELGYWQKILTDGEIMQLYNEGVVMTYPLAFEKTSTSLKNGLLGYWSFDNPDLKESVTKTNLAGTAPNVTYSSSPAKNGSCAVFNGTTSYISIPTPKYFMPNTFTVSAWAQISNISSYHEIFEVYSQQSTPKGFEFRLNGSKLELVIGHAGSSYTAVPSATTTLTSNASAFKHFVAAFDGQYVRLYIDGVLDKVQATPAINWGTTVVPRTVIGANNPQNVGFMYFWNGRLDEIGYWDRALDYSEIRNLYNSGTGKFYDQF